MASSSATLAVDAAPADTSAVPVPSKQRNVQLKAEVVQLAAVLEDANLGPAQRQQKMAELAHKNRQLEAYQKAKG